MATSIIILNCIYIIIIYFCLFHWMAIINHFIQLNGTKKKNFKITNNLITYFQDYKSGYTALHFAVALNRANLIECLLDKVDPNIESYAGKLAFEIDDDYDEDEDDDEIVCYIYTFCYMHM